MNEQKAQEALVPQGMEQESAQQPLLFALDIGTRTVIGVLGMEENGLLRVLDVVVREHTKRAMIDGQIEDIAQVAAVARAVREELETRQGVRLRRVCVAAAGRALKTLRATGEVEFGAQRTVTARDVYELEMDAVDKARKQLLHDSERNGENFSFYCVGHAVIRYHLDGYSFTSIKGHKARKAQAELIATFLPSAVVDSLYSAMEHAGMQVESVTLEPIAAMNAVIPQEIRLLNLALVDVGAGTSDIAISESGSVSAYTMATTAGDEISEELIRTFLVDFETAERIKQTAGSAGSDEIAYEDILGVSGVLTRKEALASIRPAVEALAQIICTKILEANGEKAPTAVFLVGGGSKTPFLGELVAQGLGLEPGKVALGGNNLFKRLAVSSKEIAGPEYATPLGIALTAVGDETRESFFIKVNGKPVLAVYSKEMTALDVLLMAGYKYTDLMGQSGQGLAYWLDGKECRVRGERFRPASLQINGKLAAISDRVNRGDALTVEPAVPGRDASLTVGQLLQRTESSFFVTVNGERCNLARTLLKKERPTALSDTIEQGDELSFVSPTLADVCMLWGIEPEEWVFAVNGEPAQLSQPLYHEDRVTWNKARPAEAETVELSVEAEASAAAAGVTMTQPSIVGDRMIGEFADNAAVSDRSDTAAGGDSAEKLGASQDGPTARTVGLAEAFAAAREAKAAWEAELVREAAIETQMQAQTQLDGQTNVSAQRSTQKKMLTQGSPSADSNLSEEAAPESGFLCVTVNGKKMRLPQRDTPYQFLDLLPLAGMDFKKPEGDVKLLHNGQEASYLDLITNGDNAVIGWKEHKTL